MAHVLFVCLHNAGRSQMSQALFDRAANDRHTAQSAGTTPGERVHPEVVEAMRELAIDLSNPNPQELTTDLAKRADVVVTMGCGDECPYIPPQDLHRLGPPGPQRPPPPRGACHSRRHRTTRHGTDRRARRTHLSHQAFPLSAGPSTGASARGWAGRARPTHGRR